jgi:hypothetical protein
MSGAKIRSGKLMEKKGLTELAKMKKLAAEGGRRSAFTTLSIFALKIFFHRSWSIEPVVIHGL